MIRILIIGNSHLACVKNAWDAINQDHPGFDTSFMPVKTLEMGSYALHADGFFGRAAALRNMEHGAPLPNGISDLNAYDIVVRIGFTPIERVFTRLVSGCDVFNLRNSGKRTLLSRPALEAFFAEISKGMLLPPAWCNWTNAKLVIVPRPFPDERCLQSDLELVRPWPLLAQPGEGLRELKHLFQDILAAEYAKHGITLLRQPAETEQDIGLTRQEFSLGSIKIGTTLEHSEDEYFHMNLAYGKLTLEKLFSMIETGTLALPPQPRRDIVKETSDALGS